MAANGGSGALTCEWGWSPPTKFRPFMSFLGRIRLAVHVGANVVPGVGSLSRTVCWSPPAATFSSGRPRWRFLEVAWTLGTAARGVVAS